MDLSLLPSFAHFIPCKIQIAYPETSIGHAEVGRFRGWLAVVVGFFVAREKPRLAHAIRRKAGFVGGLVVVDNNDHAVVVN